MSASTKAQVLVICGDESGVGKTSVCLGLLCAALQAGYTPEELAYIKPCTQCEDVQLLWKWCESEGIQHEGIGPILYRPGYTQEVIDGKHGSAEDRLVKIQTAVDALVSTPGRRLVIVDGVGYPAVGSCTGTSNAQMARRLGAPVLLVGRPGVGNAIDSSVMAREYFAQFSVPVLGAIFNKIPRKVSYHTYEKCKEYVTKFFAADNAAAAAATGAGVPPARTPFGVYGFVPIIKDKDGNEDDGGGACAISCALRKPSKVSLAMTEEDIERAVRTCQTMIDHVDFTRVFADVGAFYGAKAE